MPAARRDALPLAPLLHAHVASGLPTLAQMHTVPGLGRRFAAILAASARFLYSDFLDTASPAHLLDALSRFHGDTVALPLHGATLASRAGFVRHALSFLLRGEGSWPAKIAAVLEPGGAYRVPGLGPTFWSAIVQATSPPLLPAWTPATWQGLERLGLAHTGSAADRYASLLQAHARIRRMAPSLTSLHIDHFLSLLGRMRGRSLPAPALLADDHLADAIKHVRHGDGLRRLLKERGQTLATAQVLLQEALDAADGKRLGDALALADPAAATRCPLDWGAHPSLIEHARALHASDDPEAALEAFHRDALPGAGSWLPAAVLHLRDPMRWLPYGEEMQLAHSLIDDGTGPHDAPAVRYRLFAQACAVLRERYPLHPLELPFVLARLAAPEERPAEFLGFCEDTFRFLGELQECNSRPWMDSQRGRYRFVVREPLIELCRTLAERYVEPHLCGLHGWRIVTRPAPGHALTSICKNSFGRGAPYSSAMWITFCRPGRAGAQLFVRLDAAGVRFGLRLGSSCADLSRLRQAVERHGDELWRLLQERGVEGLRFGEADRPGSLRPLSSALELREWARGRSLEASASAPGDAGLAEEVIAAFDRLLPLVGCCHEEAEQFLNRLSGKVHSHYAEADFCRDTFLPEEWLRRATDLLRLKRQLILQGVPGTGKTHVARCLGRLLTRGDEAALRVVQFHPAYSYEEFVEGIKVRTVAIDGRHEVTYPVEDGLLVEFAGRAAANPSQPHVLVIDEINRGNLPRIFGELLYLLEYRGEAVELPCSRRRFALPPNLLVLGTMNAADRSTTPLDLALRRRFSFLPLEPDEAVLEAWLAAHPPMAGPAFASRVLGLFARLNSRLKTDVGPHAQVGHSHFMVPDLDEGQLRIVWQHHIRPLLEESCAGQPGRADALASLIEPRRAVNT